LTKKKLNVLIYPSMLNKNACDLYRNINPFKYSKVITAKTEYDIPLIEYRDKATRQVQSVAVDPVNIKWADVILFLRYYNYQKSELMKQLIEVIKKEGKPIIYETDDLLHKTYENSFDSEKHLGETQQQILATQTMVMQSADAMTVTTEPLKEYYSKLVNCPIYVLPNYYDPEMWDIKKSKKCKKCKTFRVGWMGGINQYNKNFEILAEPFNNLKKKYGDKIEFVVFCGRHPNQDWWPGHRNKFEFEFEYFPGSYLEDYPQTMADMNLDLGIIVVQDNEFSRSKSNIKWFEYGLLGVPSVASDVTPYQKTTAVLVKNTAKDWQEAIEMMMTDRSKYDIIKQRTVKEVKKWNIKNHFHKWEKLYLETYERKKTSS